MADVLLPQPSSVVLEDGSPPDPTRGYTLLSDPLGTDPTSSNFTFSTLDGGPAINDTLPAGVVLPSPEDEDEDGLTGYFYQVEQLTFLWVLFTLIVIGNATVLIALTLSKGRKSRMNFFIKNLAAADLCVGLISVLTDIIWKITISWEAGLVACKLIRFFQASVTYASTYVLVALSIDRYDAITHPMNFSGSWRRAKGLVVAAWVLSFAFSAPILHFYETTETEEYGTQCWIDFGAQWKWKLYMTLVSLTLFVIPAILIAGCYIIIVITIWSKGKDMVPAAGGGLTASRSNSAAMPSSDGDSTASGLGGGKRKKRRRLRRFGSGTKEESKALDAQKSLVDEVESRRASSRGLIPKAKVKTVKMTFVIIFVFILCWSPYIVFDLLQVYGCIPNNSTYAAVATFIQSLAPLNSAANPLIYCLFSTNAGQNFCNLFGCGSAPNGRAKAGHNARGGKGGATANSGSSSTSRTKSTNLDSTASTASSRSGRGVAAAGGAGGRRGPVGKTHSLVSWRTSTADEISTTDGSTATTHSAHSANSALSAANSAQGQGARSHMASVGQSALAVNRARSALKNRPPGGVAVSSERSRRNILVTNDF